MEIAMAELVNSTARLVPQDFDRFLREVYVKRAQDRTTSLPEREAVLLKKIRQNLPEAFQKRFAQLRKKRDAETLSEIEYAEYLDLIDTMETDNAEKLNHIIELANLRGIHPNALMQQLGILPLFKA